MTTAIGVIALLAAAVVAIVFVQSRNDSAKDSDPITFPTRVSTYTPYTPAPAPVTPKPTTADPPYTPPPAPTYTTPPAPPDVYESAAVGSCVYDNGTGSTVKLESTTCTKGAFKVLRIFNGTTDLDSCKNIDDYDRSVSSGLHNLVLCLSYLSPGGDAYHAEQYQCVYGPNSTGPWEKTSCKTGAFTVVAAYRGTTDRSKCESWPNFNVSKSFTVTGRSDMNVLLCLSYIYPDAIGYAKPGDCLLKSGTETHSVFSDVTSCSAANVVVNGRTSTYNAASFCGEYGWATYRVPDYSDLDYTVCWRWR